MHTCTHACTHAHTHREMKSYHCVEITFIHSTNPCHVQGNVLTQKRDMIFAPLELRNFDRPINQIISKSKVRTRL